MITAPPLSVPQTISVWRQRYPDALVCTTCGVLLATERASYSKSGLTEAARLAYVCCECRQTAAEAAHLADVRRTNLLLARAAQERGRGDTQPVMGTMRTPLSDPRNPARLQHAFLSPEPSSGEPTPLTAARARLSRRGRPRQAQTDAERQRRHREAGRRYREKIRQRGEVPEHV